MCFERSTGGKSLVYNVGGVIFAIGDSISQLWQIYRHARDFRTVNLETEFNFVSSSLELRNLVYGN